jgi:hypothetical protein
MPRHDTLPSDWGSSPTPQPSAGIKGYLTPLAIVFGAVVYGVVNYESFRPRPRPDAGPDFAAVGRAYAPVLAQTYADAWLEAAIVLEQGKSVSDAQRAQQETWKAARIAAFNARVAPELAKVLPEGAEPTDTAQRARTVAAWRGLARGLKGAK